MPPAMAMHTPPMQIKPTLCCCEDLLLSSQPYAHGFFVYMETVVVVFGKGKNSLVQVEVLHRDGETGTHTTLLHSTVMVIQKLIVPTITRVPGMPSIKMTHRMFPHK